MNTRQKGAAAETAAAEYLEQKGLVIRERNFRAKTGEIDLIALDFCGEEQVLVFVEVRYRADDACGDPAETVGPAKQRKIVRTAMNYLQYRKLPEDTPCRFDVVAVGTAGIVHYPNAFGGL